MPRSKRKIAVKCILFLLAILSGPPSPFGTVVAEEVSLAKAVITDPFGQPLPESMPLGETVRFSARASVFGPGPHAVKWIIDPPERDARKWIPASSNGIDGDVPTGLVPVTITITLVVAKGDSVDIMRIKVKCGEGPIPPPVPPVPPVPPTPVAKSLRLVVVEDQFNRKPETAAILNARKFWDGLSSAGHGFSIVAENDPTEFGKALVALAKHDMKVVKFPVGAAYLIVTNKDDGEILAHTMSLPAVPEIQALIAKYAGAK